jgi:hypothetical protein
MKLENSYKLLKKNAAKEKRGKINIVHGNGIGRKILHITIPEKNSLPAVNPPPPTPLPPSKVKWLQF